MINLVCAQLMMPIMVVDVSFLFPGRQKDNLKFGGVLTMHGVYSGIVASKIYNHLIKPYKTTLNINVGLETTLLSSFWVE